MIETTDLTKSLTLTKKTGVANKSTINIASISETENYVISCTASCTISEIIFDVASGIAKTALIGVSGSGVLTLSNCDMAQGGTTPIYNMRLIDINSGSTNAMSGISIPVGTQFAGSVISVTGASTVLALTEVDFEDILCNESATGIISVASSGSLTLTGSSSSKISQASGSAEVGYDGIHISSGKDISISNYEFTNLKKNSGDGGGIYALLENDGTFNITSCSFTGCSSSGNGGGIYLYLSDDIGKDKFNITNITWGAGNLLYISGKNLKEKKTTWGDISGLTIATTGEEMMGEDRNLSGIDLYVPLRVYLNNISNTVYVSSTDSSDHIYCGLEYFPCLTLNTANNKLNASLTTVRIISSVDLTNSLVLSNGAEVTITKTDDPLQTEKSKIHLSKESYTIKCTTACTINNIIFEIDEGATFTEPIITIDGTLAKLELNEVDFVDILFEGSNTEGVISVKNSGSLTLAGASSEKKSKIIQTSSTEVGYSGIYISSGKVISISNYEFTNLKKNNGNGGGIYASIENGGTFNIESCTFTGCSSSGNGGGIYLELADDVVGKDKFSLTNIVWGADSESNSASKGNQLYISGKNLKETKTRWIDVSGLTLETSGEDMMGEDRSLSDENSNVPLRVYLDGYGNSVYVSNINGSSNPSCGLEFFPCSTVNFALSKHDTPITAIEIIKGVDIDVETIIDLSISIRTFKGQTDKTEKSLINIMNDNGENLVIKEAVSIENVKIHICNNNVTGIIMSDSGDLSLTDCVIYGKNDVLINGSIINCVGGTVEIVDVVIEKLNVQNQINLLLLNAMDGVNIQNITLNDIKRNEVSLIKIVANAEKEIKIANTEIKAKSDHNAGYILETEGGVLKMNNCKYAGVSEAEGKMKNQEGDNMCSWNGNDMEVFVKNSDINSEITETTFENLIGGGLYISGGNLKLVNNTFKNNKPSVEVDDRYDNVRRNILCNNAGNVEIVSFGNGSDGNGNSAWILNEEGSCDINGEGIKELTSLLFECELTEVNNDFEPGKGNDKGSEENTIELVGSGFVGCEIKGIVTGYDPKNKDKSKQANKKEDITYPITKEVEFERISAEQGIIKVNFEEEAEWHVKLRYPSKNYGIYTYTAEKFVRDNTNNGLTLGQTVAIATSVPVFLILLLVALCIIMLALLSRMRVKRKAIVEFEIDEDEEMVAPLDRMDDYEKLDKMKNLNGSDIKVDVGSLEDDGMNGAQPDYNVPALPGMPPYKVILTDGRYTLYNVIHSIRIPGVNTINESQLNLPEIDPWKGSYYVARAVSAMHKGGRRLGTLSSHTIIVTSEGFPAIYLAELDKKEIDDDYEEDDNKNRRRMKSKGQDIKNKVNESLEESSSIDDRSSLMMKGELGGAMEEDEEDIFMKNKFCFEVQRWCAPELSMGEVDKVTNASDVFSLGMIIYELFTKEVPYAEVDAISAGRQIQVGNRPSMEDLRTQPEELSELIRKCISNKESDRPNADEVVREFEKIFNEYNMNGIRTSIMNDDKLYMEITERNEQERSSSVNQSESDNQKGRKVYEQNSKNVSMARRIEDLLMYIENGIPDNDLFSEPDGTRSPLLIYQAEEEISGDEREKADNDGDISRESFNGSVLSSVSLVEETDSNFSQEEMNSVFGDGTDVE